jgi:hypothetical protein
MQRRLKPTPGQRLDGVGEPPAGQSAPAAVLD